MITWVEDQPFLRMFGKVFFFDVVVGVVVCV